MKETITGIARNLAVLFSPHRIYFAGDSAWDAYLGKMPERLFLVSDIPVERLYVQLDDIMQIPFSEFGYTFEYAELPCYLCRMDSEFSSGETFLSELWEAIGKRPTYLYPFFYACGTGEYSDPFSLFYRIRQGTFRQHTGQDGAYSAKRDVVSVLWEDFYKRKWQKNEAAGTPLRVSESLLGNPSFLTLFFFGITGRDKKHLIKSFSQNGIWEGIFPQMKNLKGLGHSKEHHPEGDAYEHSIDTCRRVESYDLALNVAALFHDLGKFGTVRHSIKEHEQKFPGHSQVSVSMAKKSVGVLADCFPFYPLFKEKVFFLIENHMSVANLPYLDSQNRQEMLSSQWLTDLLKLYKADLAASLRSLHQYVNVSSYLKKLGKTR